MTPEHEKLGRRQLIAKMAKAFNASKPDAEAFWASVRDGNVPLVNGIHTLTAYIRNQERRE